MDGFIVTWDVDSADAAQCARLKRFVYGQKVTSNSRTYEYLGFVEKEGVRYLGQSVLFVVSDHLTLLRGFLTDLGIPHVVTRAWLGSILPS